MSYSILVELMKKTGNGTGFMWELTVRKNDYYHFINWFFIYHSLERIVSISYWSISQHGIGNQSFIHSWTGMRDFLVAVHSMSSNTSGSSERREKRKIRNTGINFENKCMHSTETQCKCTCNELRRRWDLWHF